MLYTEKEKHELERVREAFAGHIRQSTDFDLVWSDKVGYVWLSICLNPFYVDTGRQIKSAADLCQVLLDDIADDVFLMTKTEHTTENADPLETEEIRRRWKPYMDQLPEYAYLCAEMLGQ